MSAIASGDEHGPDDRGEPAEPTEQFCANHPDREATAACAECLKALCSECVFAAGGGHSFCKECMEGSRLVEAEPQIIGRVVEEEAPAQSRTAMLAVLLVLAVLALLAAVFVGWGLLSKG